jgi:hypothetical protein
MGGPPRHAAAHAPASPACPAQNGSHGSFRVKVLLRTSNCGELTVKMRVSVSGKHASIKLWGHSTSR